MAKARPLFKNFSGGEVAPQLDGLIDGPAHGCLTLENFIVRKQAGITRRPGTKYAGAAYSDSGYERLCPFTNAAGTSFVLEFADTVLRVWKQSTHAVIATISGVPWADDDVFALKFIAIQDNLYITHKTYPPICLTWLSDTLWQQRRSPYYNNQKLVGAPSYTLSGHTYADFVSSPDGISWTKGSIGAGSGQGAAVKGWSVRAVTGFAGKYIAIVGAYALSGIFSCFISEDLVSWEKTAAGFPWVYSPVLPPFLAANDDIIVCVNYATIYTSSDEGTSWSQRTIPVGVASGTFFTGIVWADAISLFVAIGYKTGQAYLITSADGITWAKETNPTAGVCSSAPSLFYVNGKIFGSETSDAKILVSSDGHTFVEYDLVLQTGNSPFEALNFDTRNKKWAGIAAVASTTFSDGLKITKSADGAIWSSYIPLFQVPLQQVTSFFILGDRWIATAVYEDALGETDTKSYVFMSDDQGATWNYVVDINVQTGVTGNVQKLWLISTKFGNVSGKYPAAIGYVSQRLLLGGSVDAPDTIWGSCIGQLNNFTPGYLGTDGLEFRLSSSRNANIYWMESVNKGLCIGAKNGVGFLQGGQETGLTPNSAQFDWVYPHGCADIQGIRVGNNVFYAQRGGEILRAFPSDVEITLVSSHITKGGVTQFEYMDDPQCLFFAVRSDGQLPIMVAESTVTAWQRWVTRDGDEIESIAVVPAGTEDEIWMSVKRDIGGTTKRFIEYSVPFAFEDKDHVHYVDCGVEQENADEDTITNVTKANPAVVTASGHPFVNGNYVLIRNVDGMIELNNNVYQVSGKLTDSFKLVGTDSSLFTAYTSGGNAYEVTATVSGLTHINGEDIVCLIDGNVVESHTVTANEVTLTRKGHHVHVGLPWSSKAQLCRMGTGLAHGIPKQVSKLFVWVYESIGGKFGSSEAKTESVAYDHDSELTTDLLALPYPGDWDANSYIWAIQSDPLPMTVMAIGPEVTVGER